MLDRGMEDKLESSVIRSLILNSRFANGPNFQFSDITPVRDFLCVGQEITRWTATAQYIGTVSGKGI